MCVIVYKPKGKVFSTESFKECWARNSHGFGFLVLDPFLCQKGVMDEKKALKLTKKFRGPEHDVVYHFRIQSKGAITPALTHPFPFHKDGRKRFLFHNGTIQALNPGKIGSDSSMAADILSLLSDEDATKVIQKWDSSGRFILVMEDDQGELVPHLFADNESKIIDGVWYSNLRHKIKVKYYPQSAKSHYDDLNDWKNNLF